GLSQIPSRHCILTNANVTDLAGRNSLTLRPEDFHGYPLLRKSNSLRKGIMLLRSGSRNQPRFAGRILNPEIFADLSLDLFPQGPAHSRSTNKNSRCGWQAASGGARAQ